MKRLAILIGAVALFGLPALAQSTLYYSQTSVANGDGSVTVTPTASMSWNNDNGWCNPGDGCTGAADQCAVVVNGNNWVIGPVDTAAIGCDAEATFTSVTIAAGSSADLSYAGKVEGATTFAVDPASWDDPSYDALYDEFFSDGLVPSIPPQFPCVVPGCPNPLPDLWVLVPMGYHPVDMGTEQVPQTETVDSPPVITGIYPSGWYAGTTQSVTFTGQYFGTNAPTLNFSPASGISYALTSYNDTQIVANVTVASGTPNEAVDVTVTNNGYGTGFQGAGQSGTSSSPVQAQVLAPINSPEVTVIAWVNASAPDLNPLPSGANAILMASLNSGPAPCAAQVIAWTLGSRLNVFSSADVAYANAWLVKNSANPAPPSSISPAAQESAGNYRLFNDFGNGKGGYNVGITPDPCNTGLIPGWLAAGQPSQYIGPGTSSSGKPYQLAEGRIGRAGQIASLTLNLRTVPWIWSVIEFDSAGNPTYSDRAMFPTYSVYVNGSWVVTYAQSPVASFVANNSTYQRTPAQIP